MEQVIGSLYVGKSDKFQTGMSVDRDVSKTLMTGGECAIVIGYIGQSEHNANAIYSPDGISPTLVTGHGNVVTKIVDSPVRLGNVYNDKFGPSFGGSIWDTDGIAPTLKTTSAASQQFVVQKAGEDGRN